MVTQNDKQQPSDSAARDFLKQELAQAINAGLDQIKLLIQILTVLAVANVSIIGYAISKTSGGALFIGGFIPLAVMYILYRGAKFIVPVVYSATILEEKLGKDQNGLLVSTFIEYAISPEYLLELRNIATIADSKERISKLQKSSLPIFRSIRFNLILGLISAIQFILPFFLNGHNKWKFF
jgi:hypothetical protein